MNTLAAFGILVLTGLVASAPINDSNLTVTSEFFPDSLSVYKSEHHIVNLFCPLNSLNFDENTELDSLEDNHVYVFFVEGELPDATANQNSVADSYKGLYFLKNKQATKLLDNGRDFAASTDDSKQVFFAATDGIYVFNSSTELAEKYGTVSDSLIAIAMSNSSNDLYVLTEDHVLYKVTEEGTKKEEVPDVKDAVQIVFDFEDNLFFLDVHKNVYVKTVKGVVRKVEGLPDNHAHVKLIRPPFVLEQGVPFISGDEVFAVYPNGTNEFMNMVLEAKPTAFSVEATILQYYAYDKEIYEYNLLTLIVGSLLEIELQTYLNDNTDNIKSIGQKSRTSFRNRQ